MVLGLLLLIYFHFPSQIMALERCPWGHEPGNYGLAMIAAVLPAEGLRDLQTLSRARLVPPAGAGKMGWDVALSPHHQKGSNSPDKLQLTGGGAPGQPSCFTEGPGEQCDLTPGRGLPEREWKAGRN